MNLQTVGNIWFFTNVPNDVWLSDEERANVSLQIACAYQRNLGQSNLSDVLRVGQVVYDGGCVITILQIIGTIGAAGMAVGTFLDFYPGMKVGAVELAKDLNGLRIRISSKQEKKESTWFYKADFGEVSDVPKSAEVLSEQDMKILLLQIEELEGKKL